MKRLVQRLIGVFGASSDPAYTEPPDAPPANLPANSIAFYPAPKMLLHEKTQKYRKDIHKAMQCTDDFMSTHIDELIIWLFSHTQGLPASLNDHHRTPYGLFFHSLDVALIALNRIKADNSFFPDGLDSTISKDTALLESRVFLFLLAICHDLGKVSQEMIIKIHLPGEETLPFDSHKHAPYSNALYFDLLDALDAHQTLDRSDISRCYYSHRHRTMRGNFLHQESMLHFAFKALRETGTQPLSKQIRKHLDWNSAFLQAANQIQKVADRLSSQEDLSTRRITTEELRSEHLSVLRYLARSELLDGIEESDERYFLQRNFLSAALHELPSMKDWLNVRTNDADDFVRFLRVTSDIETVTNADHDVPAQGRWQKKGKHSGVLLESSLTSELVVLAVDARLAREAAAAKKAEEDAKDAVGTDMRVDDVDGTDTLAPQPASADDSTSAPVADAGDADDGGTTSIDISALGEAIPPPPPSEGIPLPTEPKAIDRSSPSLSPDPDSAHGETEVTSAPQKTSESRPPPRHKKKSRGSPPKDRGQNSLGDHTPRSAVFLDNLFQTDIGCIVPAHGALTTSGSFLLDKKYLLSVLDEMNCASRDELTRLRAFCDTTYPRYWSLTGSSQNRLELKPEYLEKVGFEFNDVLEQILEPPAPAKQRPEPPRTPPQRQPAKRPSQSSPKNEAFTPQAFEAFLLKAFDAQLPPCDDDETVEIPMTVFHDYVVDKTLKGRALDLLKKPGLIDRHTKRTIHINPSLLESDQWQRS